MAHFEHDQLVKPTGFNFAKDVIDFWASEQSDAQAMYWVSGDLTKSRKLSFTYFQRQSHRVAILLTKLGIKPGERVVMILPRIPAW
jgi:acyl-coenzyme A synthetase/AMP-(fatty) acid ligase